MFNKCANVQSRISGQRMSNHVHAKTLFLAFQHAIFQHFVIKLGLSKQTQNM